MVSSLLSSPVVVRSPEVDATFPATSRAVSMNAHTFSVLIRSSGMFPPSLATGAGNGNGATPPHDPSAPLPCAALSYRGIGRRRETGYDANRPRRATRQAREAIGT